MALKIESEDQAWSLLAQALDGKLDFDADEPLVLDFSGWPKVDILLPNTSGDATITPTMMEALLEFQRAIYRSYTLVESDSPDLRTLSKQEKDSLEFRVKVSGGCSQYLIDLSPVLERIGLEAIAKMDQTGIIICVLGLATIIAATTVWRAKISARVQERQAELDDAEKQRWLDAQLATLEFSKENMEILARAKDSQPLLSDIDAIAEQPRQNLVRAIGEERGGTVAGMEISPELASELSAQKRQQSEQIRLVGNYRVGRIDPTHPDGFRAVLIDEADGREFSAMLQDALLSAEHKQVIQEAEWSKVPFYAEITAKRLGNRIVDAVVIAARKAEAPA